MIRPCFLIIDRETSTAISTRKLVVETAKFNVITAYSSDEAIATLKRYPALDLVVTDSGMQDMACDDLITELKKIKPAISVIVVQTPRGTSSDLADYTLESFEPKHLLDLLRSLRPKATEEIKKHEQVLEDKYFEN